MNFVNIFKTLKQVTLNAMDIKFLKAKTDILATKLNKDVHSTLTSISEEVRDTRTDIANIKDVTDKIEFTGDKISSDCLPSYVESIKDIYVDEDTGDFYNVETVVDPVTQEVSYELGSTIVLRVPGIIYYDINLDKTYRVSNIGKVIEITTSEQYYTKDEADSNFASIDTRSIKVISITSEYDNISIGNESLIRYISNVGYSDILNYINDNNLVVAKYNNSYYSLADISSNTIVFSAVTDSRTIETFSIGSNNIIHYNVKQINVPELYVVPLVLTISKANILSYLQYLDSNKPVIFKRIDIAENNPRTQCTTFIPVNYYYRDGSCIHLYGFSENKLNHITIEPLSENTYTASIQALYLVFDEDLEQLYLEKLNKLVSGTNIKTIDGTSVLGSGDVKTSLVLTLSVDELGNYTLNKTFSEISEAIASGFYVTISNAYRVSNVSPTAIRFSRLNQGYISVENPTLLPIMSEIEISNTDVVTVTNRALLDTLVSGTNIKTVNGTSLLGSGNISTKEILTLSNDLPSVGTAVNSDDYTLIESAATNGMLVQRSGVVYYLYSSIIGTPPNGYAAIWAIKFNAPTDYMNIGFSMVGYAIRTSDHVVTKIEKFNANTKADKVTTASTIPSGGALPNVCYNLGKTNYVNITLNSRQTGEMNIWRFIFTALSSSCQVMLPNNIILANGYTWNMLANRKFFVKIVDNVAFVDWADLI